MKMHINGEWVDAENYQTIDVINPATEEIIDTVPDATAEDVDKAVSSSCIAFKTWGKTTASMRSMVLKEISRKLALNAQKYSQLLTEEQGNILVEHEEEIAFCIETIDYYSQLIKHGIGRVLPANKNSCMNFVIKEPYGPTACIIPFNYPFLLLFWKAAAALAAGNTIIIKPSEKTPLSTLKLMIDVFDHVPKGVINIITGGAIAGACLSAHPDVPTVAFTGSTDVGVNIIQTTARSIKNLHLELGGKDAAVVTDGVDITLTARALCTSAMSNAGQICTSTERIYVERSIYDAFIKELTAVIKGLNLGPGDVQSSEIGPLCDINGFNKVERHIEDARAKGARILVGGQRSKKHEKGYFFEPTLVVDANHSMLCMTEETFGPMVAVMPFDDFEEAINLVNSTQYGLGAILISHDPIKIKQFFEDVKAGTIWINDPLPDNVAGPFGGMKTSGSHARELGIEGLESFMETKHVHWEFEPANLTEQWFDKK